MAKAETFSGYHLLEEGRYELIVGDDISGRIPTLAAREYANFISHQLGRSRLPTVFLQDKHAANVSDLEDQLQKRILPFLGNDHCEKILYVTEYVESGSKVRGS